MKKIRKFVGRKKELKTLEGLYGWMDSPSSSSLREEDSGRPRVFAWQGSFPLSSPKSIAGDTRRRKFICSPLTAGSEGSFEKLEEKGHLV